MKVSARCTPAGARWSDADVQSAKAGVGKLAADASGAKVGAP
jgi:hypothetical protein